MKTKLALIMVLLLATSVVRSQDVSCADILNQARQKFDQGHFYEISNTLKSCLNKGFNKSQKIAAYRLLTRTYLYLDRSDSAEVSYLKLLKLDPEYKVSPVNDPIDLVYLSERFTTTPIFLLMTKVGINTSVANVINNYGVDNTNNTFEQYSSGLGFQIALGSELNLNEQFSVGLEFSFFNKHYNYSNVLYGEDNQSLKETQLGIELPLYVKYRSTFNKFQPFAYIGISPYLLLDSKADVSVIDKLLEGNETASEVPVDGPSESLTNLRAPVTLSAIFGLGMNYRVRYDYLTLDFRLNYGVSNIVDIKDQYQNNNLLYRYGYVDDDKSLNTLIVSVGYVRPLYKPRRVDKNSRFLKNLFKKKQK